MESQARNIVIYGGSFNPPTVAHEAITRACLEVDGVDEVWLMPSGDRIDKQYDLSDNDRLRMLSLLCEEVFSSNQKLKISRFEIDNLPRPTETLRTVEALKAYYPGNNFQFVFGADSYQSMPSWRNGRELQKRLGMLIVPRWNISIPSSPNLTILETPRCTTVSSSQVRENVQAGVSVESMVCSSVCKYIEDSRLYKGLVNS